MKTCINDKCGSEFSPRRRDQKYCTVACRERASTQRYANNHKEKVLLKNRLWFANNPDYRSEYYEKNKEAVCAKSREKYATNTAWREYRSQRGNWHFGEHLSLSDLTDLQSQDCFYCGGPGGTADHLVPRAKGGEDRLDNLVPACLSCNSSKNNLDLQDWYERRPIALY